MSDLKRILYAEDNPNDVELTLAALAECNLANKVDVVRDGQEVLEYLASEGAFSGRGGGLPILVLLDLKMPRVDGIEVLKRLKGDEKLRTIPVVMLTSSREEKDLVESYRLGVNAYVVKPIGFSEFIEAVKQLGVFWAIMNEVPGPHAP
ncbi:MAG: response regulator [Spirochaetia bacterium]